MLIQKALERLLERPHRLVIAHRSRPSSRFDRIIVLQNGEIIEERQPRPTDGRRRLHAKLYNMNYASFDDIPDEESRTGGGRRDVVLCKRLLQNRVTPFGELVATPRGMFPAIAASSTTRQRER